MEDSGKRNDSAKVALITLCVLAILFAMRAAQVIVLPILLAFFLAVLAESPVAWLAKRRIPRFVGIFVTVTSFAALLLGVTVLVGSSLQDLTARVPTYRASLRTQLDALVAAFGGSPADSAGIFEEISPDAALGLATYLLNGVRDIFSNAFLIVFLLIFMLFEFPVFVAKLEALGSSQGTWRSITESVRGYLAIKSLTSFATGVLIGIALVFLKVDFAILWGLLAFLLNYIPSIGSIIASVPAVLLTLVEDGFGSAVVVAAVFLAINVAIGNGVEPRLLGEGLGLSTLVVFLSLISWGWLLGPIGMLLSVPLTTVLKIALEKRPETRAIAFFLGKGQGLAFAAGGAVVATTPERRADPR